MKKYLLCWIMLTMCMTLTSCKPKNDLEYILSNASCDSPCWLGMTPGATMVEEAHQQLVTYPGVVNQEKIFDVPAREAYPQRIRFEVLFSESLSYLHFENGQLSLIEINVDKKKMKLESGIGLYGTPEKVIYQSYNCAARFVGQTRCTRIYLDYPQKGLILSYQQKGGDFRTLIIDPNQQIDLVYFYVPGSDPLQELTSWLDGERIIDWPGYAEIVDIWD